MTPNRFRPYIDDERCMGCELCKQSCDSTEVKECLVLKNGVMNCRDEDTCLAAQPTCEYRCVKLCPTKAFRLHRAI